MTSVEFLSIPIDSDQDMHICGRCKIMFYVLTDFTTHKNTDCGKIPQIVDTDNQINSVKSIIKSEIDIPYKCDSKPDDDLIKSSLAKKEKFKCPVDTCDYSSFLMKDIKRHVRTHTGERPFKCMLCPKMFTRNDKFSVHLRIHRGEKKYKCSQCDYAAVESNTLLRHSRIHTGQKPYKCQLCSYKARDKSQLTVHLRMHTGDSPYICAHEKCKAAFKTSTGLKRHATVHSPKNPIPCSYCPYKANSKADLLCHNRKKHPSDDDTNFQCSQCEDRYFASKAKLTAHFKSKHTKNDQFKEKKIVKNHGLDLKSRYECTQCEASFVCQESLRIHDKQHDKMVSLQNDSHIFAQQYVDNVVEV